MKSAPMVSASAIIAANSRYSSLTRRRPTWIKSPSASISTAWGSGCRVGVVAVVDRQVRLEYAVKAGEAEELVFLVLHLAHEASELVVRRPANVRDAQRGRDRHIDVLHHAELRQAAAKGG